MDAPNPKIAELEQLLWRMRDGAIDDDGLARIETLVTGDAEVRRFYIRFSTLCGGLRWLNAGEGRGMAGSPAIDVSVGAAVEHPVGTAVELPHQLDPEPQIPEPPFPTLSTTHYPLPTSHFSVGSWAFSCMVATVIMGGALLGLWAIKVTHHQHIAEAPSQSAPSETMPEMVFVGRITGMVDVKWSDDPHFLPPLSSRAYVPLGRKYILSSGLLEITYDSGAKVILEGPCTYEVESTAGGYLALGKLTARVEKERSEARGQKSDPSPLSPLPSPLFSVRTPTALITDLGTEFGVEVDKAGASKAHVFQGMVEMRLADGGRGEPLTIQLGVGESGRVEHGADGREPTLLRGTADAAAFAVRPGQLATFVKERQLKPFHRWQAFSEELQERDDLLAYYDFQPDEHDRALLRNRAATGDKCDRRIKDATWVPGRFPGKYALRFGWSSAGVRVYVPGKCQRLTLAAWVRLDSLPRDPSSLLTSHGWWKMGQVRWLVLRDGKMSLSVVVGPRADVSAVSSRPVVDEDHLGQWRLVAAVCDLAAQKVVFYCNGDCVGRQALDTANLEAFDIDYATIGDWYDPGAPFAKDFSLQGRVGELMVFRAALSQEEIRRIYRSADVALGGTGILPVSERSTGETPVPPADTVGAAVELPPQQESGKEVQP